MARTTVFHFKGHDIDPRRVGRDLKVESVLTGTLAKHGETLRIEAELVNVGNGSEIWGEHYNRSASSISAVESDIAHDIANGLRLDIAADSSVGQIKQSTTSAEAYQLYLKGRYEWNKRSEVGLNKAIEYFEQAIKTDPTYTLAYAGLADSYTLRGSWEFLPPREAYPKAKEAAEKALQLDNFLAEAHTSLAWIHFVYDWDWDRAERELKRELN
jgi:tetratricopeptide (TPR) repeat protein